MGIIDELMDQKQINNNNKIKILLIIVKINYLQHFMCHYFSL